MSRARLYLPLIIIAAACSETAPTAVEAPVDFDPSFLSEEVIHPDFPTRGSFQADALTECRAECSIKVGETHLLGWAIPGAADEVKGIRSPAQIAFVVPTTAMGFAGPTDTIPGPPAPGPVRHAIRLAGGATALTAMFELAFGADAPPTDTIPGPPAPFVFYNGEHALMLFAVQDLMNKGVLRQTSTEVSTPLAVIWTTGSGQSTQSWSAVGMLPPTDTIPGPPGPAPTATKRGR